MGLNEAVCDSGRDQKLTDRCGKSKKTEVSQRKTKLFMSLRRHK